jgi:hypothetical protein
MTPDEQAIDTLVEESIGDLEQRMTNMPPQDVDALLRRLHGADQPHPLISRNS